MRKVNIVIFFMCCSLFVRAQGAINDNEPKLLGSFNFTQFIGGVVLIQARFDTISTPLNFILDTGSGGISLDSSTCEEFNIQGMLTDTFISGIGGLKQVKFVFGQTLHMDNITIDNLNFHINNYDPLTRIYGTKIDGIIGYSFFKRYIVKLDYDNKKMEVYSPGKITYPRNGYLLKPTFTALPIQKVEVTDQRKVVFPFYFDTGAGLALLLNNKFATDSSIIKPNRKPVVTGVEGLLGRSVMRLTVIKKLELGPFTFKRVPTYLYQDVYNVTGYPHIGGLLGSEIFRRFNLILNYSKKEIHMQPNTHYNDAFDYSYTGMNLYFINGAILVDDVIPGSPADKAGIKIGDEIISVGNDLSLSIESYRNSLQVEDEIVKLIIRRNGNLENMIMRTSSILD